MKMPNDYATTTAYGEDKYLPLGGHICRIMGVEETTSKNGDPMLKISLDIAREDGEFAGYYADRYRNDTRDNKKWGCVVNQLVYDKQGGTNKGFKTFCTAVEKSNPGFAIQWGDAFCNCFKDKLIGGVFGREQYKGNDGKLHFATKCVQFRSVDAIREGVDVPADKLYEEPGSFTSFVIPGVANMAPPEYAPHQNPAGFTQSSADFEPLEDIKDDALPFEF